jgi:RNA polymerase sigma-70 factor (ECF subfamily)
MAAPPREDPALIRGIRERDPDTLEAVARENLRPLLRAARASGLARDAAMDTVQETLLIFVEKAEEFDGRARVRTWLFGILYRKIQEARRAFWREAATDEPDAFMEQWFDGSGRWVRTLSLPDSGAAMNQAMAWLRRCLDLLPDRQRTLFVLREIEQLDTDELCNVCGITSNNVGVLLFRARNGLRGCLEKQGLKGAHDAAL